jgi:carboxyl-terminal processing protease
MPFNLTDGSELRLTISRYYTPAGRSIQKSYAKGVKDYESDLEKRYASGEFFSADSIKFADSLKFKTLTGRTVYGGGGIMPDVFVPLDTSEGYRYLNALANKFVIREYALLYVDKHNAELKAMGLPKYLKDFTATPTLVKEVIDMGEKAGVKYNEKQFLKSEKDLKNLVKAYIARHIWKDEGFFPVIHQNDEVFQKAMALFAKATEVEKKSRAIKGSPVR